MNTKYVLPLIQNYANARKEINQDDFLELVDGLDESEVEEILQVMNTNGFEVVEEYISKNSSLNYSKLRGLTNEELCVLYQQGDKEALDALCINNERLVHKVAITVMKQYQPEVLTEEDLYIEGNFGLTKAARMFDVSMGNRFSTYAMWWIKQSITREVMNNGYGMRLPVHVFEQIILVNKCRKRHPGSSIEELRAYISEECDKYYEIEKLEKLLIYADKYLNCASLNRIVNDADGGDTEVQDFIPADASVEDQVMDTIISEQISEVLNTLSEKEHAIISMRFGLEGNNQMTLEEIGVIYNVTRERIRQIEAKAIRKLAQPSRAKKLEGLYA